MENEIQATTCSVEFAGESDALTALFAALATAREKFTDVKKTSIGQIGSQKFKYATMSTLVDASMPYLAKAGIAVLQPLTGAPMPGYQRIVTIVAGHGARIVTNLDFLPHSDIKEYGKQTTYLRRYAYNALFVLDGEPDADEAAVPHVALVTKEQQQEIFRVVTALDIDEKTRNEVIVRVVGHLKKSHELTGQEAERLLVRFEALLSAKNNTEGAK